MEPVKKFNGSIVEVEKKPQRENVSGVSASAKVSVNGHPEQPQGSTFLIGSLSGPVPTRTVTAKKTSCPWVEIRRRPVLYIEPLPCLGVRKLKLYVAESKSNVKESKAKLGDGPMPLSVIQTKLALPKNVPQRDRLKQFAKPENRFNSRALRCYNTKEMPQEEYEQLKKGFVKSEPMAKKPRAEGEENN